MTRPKNLTLAEVQRAGEIYLRVLVADRDARRLLDAAKAELSRESLDVLRRAADSDLAPMVVEYKEASDRIGLFMALSDGSVECPEGRTVESALAASGGRYKRGKCTLCRGPALPCAKRHARGRSCA